MFTYPGVGLRVGCVVLTLIIALATSNALVAIVLGLGLGLVFFKLSPRLDRWWMARLIARTLPFPWRVDQITAHGFLQNFEVSVSAPSGMLETLADQGVDTRQALAGATPRGLRLYSMYEPIHHGNTGSQDGARAGADHQGLDSKRQASGG